MSPDVVEVGVYVDGDELLPVRLRVHDGADDVDAHAFLSTGAAETLIELLTLAVRRARERYAEPVNPVNSPAETGEST